ncbi:hypothetical protein [Prevotella koreensis]|uniref:hypothetical protein n=1 Tax=Prevotella koreensis TaxID=2490854 RepID=UPI0028E99E84|nr:hypothetical protein [Prevotella koreensis]
MDKLNESLNLMRRLCNLPSNEEELRKTYNFNDDQINDIRKAIRLFDPETSEVVRRWKEINDYIEGKTKHD